MAEFFSEKGDSGAPVISNWGEVLGFILGGSDGRPLVLKGHEELSPVYVTYISPATMVMKRIAKKMGDVEIIVEDLSSVTGTVSLAESLGELSLVPKISFSCK